MIFLRTDYNGRVTLRHNRPGDLSAEQKADGVLVDVIPDAPGPGYDLYVENGAPIWKTARHRYANDVGALKVYLKEQISAQREAVESSGVQYNGHTFRSDEGGRQSIAETLAYARDYNAENADTFSAEWKTIDGFLTVTEADLKAVRDLMAAQRQQAFVREAELTVQVDAATTADELLPLDIDSGW
jgi:hypothetical protein